MAGRLGVQAVSAVDGVLDGRSFAVGAGGVDVVQRLQHHFIGQEGGLHFAGVLVDDVGRVARQDAGLDLGEDVAADEVQLHRGAGLGLPLLSLIHI